MTEYSSFWAFTATEVAMVLNLETKHESLHCIIYDIFKAFSLIQRYFKCNCDIFLNILIQNASTHADTCYFSPESMN